MESNEQRTEQMADSGRTISVTGRLVAASAGCPDGASAGQLAQASVPAADRQQAARPLRCSKLYGTDYWLLYSANLLLVTANALVFRFADFVSFLGGTEAVAGLIVGLGTAFGIPMRLWLGRLVDYRGPRYVWIGSGLMFAASCLAFARLTGLGPAIYLARIGFWCGMAGMFSCSIIYICTGVPVRRRAELIGTLGTSGFIGMIVGPHLGDWLFRSFGTCRLSFELMFMLAGAMGLGCVLIVWYLTRGDSTAATGLRLPLLHMLVRHWPGWIGAVATMMGLSMVVSGTYLTRFREYRHLGGIGWFFLVYSSTAFVIRVAGRRLPERVGRGRAVVAGLVFLSVSMLLYLPVRTDWHLMLPALAGGVAHALLFPSVTTLGAEAFPERFRATGIALIMALVDVGVLCWAPLLGAVIVWLGFEAMFMLVAALSAAVAVCFVLSRRVSEPADGQTSSPPLPL